MAINLVPAYVVNESMSENYVVPAYQGEGEVLSRSVVEVLEDGTRVIETLIKKDSGISTYAQERATFENRIDYETNGVVHNWAQLTATFTYDKAAKTVSCISKHATYSKTSLFINESITATNGGLFTPNVKVKLNYRYLAIAPIDRSITITCDSNGNVSY